MGAVASLRLRSGSACRVPLLHELRHGMAVESWEGVAFRRRQNPNVQVASERPARSHAASVGSQSAWNS
jgi:hypothetical protein